MRVVLISLLIVSVIGLIPASSSGQVGSWLIKPGAGVGPLFVGMKEPGVIAVLGPPRVFCTGSPEGQSYLYYPEKGLIIWMDSSTLWGVVIVNGFTHSVARSRGCSADGVVVMDANALTYVTQDGVQLGTSVQRVIAAMGTPKSSHAAVADKDVAMMTKDEAGCARGRGVASGRQGANRPFLGVATSRIPASPETLGDPKRTVVDIARHSRRRDIRDDMVPRPGSGREVGQGYAAHLIEFISNETSGWRPDVAAENAESLDRCVRRLRGLALRWITDHSQ